MAGAGGSFGISFLLVIVVGAGCLAPVAPSGGSNVNAADDGTFEFEWSPTDDHLEVAFLAQVTAGAGSECTVDREAEGFFGHESGLGLFFALFWSHGLLTQTAQRVETPSAHAGPVNTFQVTGGVWTTLTNGGRWSSEGGGMPFENETRVYLLAAFDLQKDSDPLFSVACEGPSASLRFYRALEVVPISSPAAKGGAGFYTWLFPSPVQASLNHGDRYSLTTEADLTVMMVRETPASARWPTDPVVEGQLDLSTPQGREVIPIEPGPWNATRFWRGPGTYEMILDRIAVGVWPLVGIMGGFVLEEELGSRDGLPASRLDQTEPWAPTDP